MRTCRRGYRFTTFGSLWLVFLLTASLVVILSSAVPLVTASSDPPLRGPGEDYELAWTYQTVPNNLVAAWNSFYSSSTFQGFQSKFNWNVIRLGFRLNGAFDSSEQYLNVANFTNMDIAVAAANANCLTAFIDEFDYAVNFWGSPAWVSDWNAIATHYSGNPNVMFGIINEPVSSSYCSTTIGCEVSETDAIHAITPTRLIS